MKVLVACEESQTVTIEGTDSRWHIETLGLPKEERAKIRSKTFPGVAEAMAEQWAGVCEEWRGEQFQTGLIM